LENHIFTLFFDLTSRKRCPASDFIDEIKFTKEFKKDTSGREKYHPISTSVFTRLAYVSPLAVESLAHENCYEFDAALITDEKFLRKGGTWYTANTGLYIKDYELVCEYSDCPFFNISVDELIILNSEVERLEQEHENSSKRQSEYGKLQKGEATSTVDSLPYQTSLLELLAAAMKRSFPADRINDPPKAVVVTEMKQIADEMGLNLSDNIAEAMFTIIRPEDHNPRKRRLK